MTQRKAPVGRRLVFSFFFAPLSLLTMRSHTREKVRPMVATVFPQSQHNNNDAQTTTVGAIFGAFAVWHTQRGSYRVDDRAAALPPSEFPTLSSVGRSSEKKNVGPSSVAGLESGRRC